MIEPRPQPTALVTGASSGLGVELARQLARRGYRVVLVARRVDRLQALADELRALGQTSVVVAADLSAPGAAQKLLDDLDARGLELDLLVNNAGVGLYGSVLDHTPERVASMLRLNIVALTELALVTGRRMAARGSGTLINVSSTASFQPDPWLAVYGASKAYVTSFSLALGEELAPHGVRVLTVCPGLTRTEFDEAAGVRAARSADWMYMSAERAARITLRALDQKRRIVILGWMNRLAAFFARRAPLELTTRVNGWLLAPAAQARAGQAPKAGEHDR
jgi:short-subunit dehydrogenase